MVLSCLLKAQSGNPPRSPKIVRRTAHLEPTRTQAGARRCLRQSGYRRRRRAGRCSEVGYFSFFFPVRHGPILTLGPQTGPCFRSSRTSKGVFFVGGHGGGNITGSFVQLSAKVANDFACQSLSVPEDKNNRAQHWGPPEDWEHFHSLGAQDPKYEGLEPPKTSLFEVLGS